MSAGANGTLAAPHDAAGWAAAGRDHQRAGRLADAAAAYRRSLALDPGQPRLLNSLGVVSVHLGRPADAEHAFRAAAEADPASGRALHNLGNVLAEQGKHADAADAFERAEGAGFREPSLYDGWAAALSARGRFRAAEELLQQAVRRWPDDPTLLLRLGQALAGQLCWDGATACLRRAVELRPADPEARKALGSVLVRLGRLDQAEGHLREAVRARPADAAAGNEFAVALLHQGKLDEATAALDRVIAADPGNAAAHSTRLYLLNSDHRVAPDALLAEHRAWAAKFAAGPPADPQAFPNDRTPTRRVRVGYVSPDFRRHPVGRFIEPVLAAHDPAAVEVVCYDEATRSPDEVTARLRRTVPVWRVTRGLSHDRFAELVRGDRIDILVDLAGHTADNRLAAFARRLAPVQVTYLGYPNTTGVPAIDYRLTDPVADPPGWSAFLTEQAVRLPGGFCCLAPRDDAPPVSPLPAAAKGFVTFAAPHTLGRLNAAVLDLWADLIRTVPDARLVVARSTLGAGTRDYFRGQFAARGVPADRVELRPLASGEGEFLGFYRDVDVTLDTFPWSGHTTACESLWMGVPVVTLRGDTHRGRMVASVLTHAGLADWVAEAPAQYLDLARRWAADRAGLARLRAGLRDRLRFSALCDAAGFTRHLEAAYRRMWQGWCAGGTIREADGAPPAPVPAGPVAAEARAHNREGIRLAGERDFAAAEIQFRRAAELAPSDPKAFHNLGNVLSEQGKLAEAVGAYRRAEALGYRTAALFASLGVALLRLRQFPAAEAAFRSATQLNPNDAECQAHHGTVLLELNRPREAADAFQAAARLGRRDAEVADGLAQALARLGQYREAVGPAAEAARLRPDDPDVLKRLGFVMNKVARFTESVDAYTRAIALRPADADAHWRLGMVHTRQGFLDRAVGRCREAVRLQPGNPVYHSGLASAFIQNGDIKPALAGVREAMRLAPAYAEAHSSLLFMLCYDPDATPGEVFEEHLAWARKFAPPPAVPPVHANDRTPGRRLRVGYVSPDLRNHPVGFFLEPVILAHDPAAVDLVCYDECVWPPDDLAGRLQRKVADWRVSRGWSDAEFAEQIRRDRIDVLVDLAGHSASNRLKLFALKPAPVQATYLGYPNTTGIPAVDYRLTDAVADPPDRPAYMTETPYRLAGGFCVFAPRPGTPGVSPSPAARNGYVTFGSLHNQAKLNPRVLDLWAAVLRAVPTAALLFVRHTLTEEARAGLRTVFAARGVDAGRLRFHQPPAGSGEYIKAYADVDVQLDPFPWSGHTTACEGLWMGVPTVTLRGHAHAGRMVASVLTHAGLPEWVADSPEHYVEVAREWAADVPALAGLRAGMRDRLRASRLCDVAGFTRHLEAAYRDMWGRYCRGG